MRGILVSYTFRAAPVHRSALREAETAPGDAGLALAFSTGCLAAALMVVMLLVLGAGFAPFAGAQSLSSDPRAYELVSPPNTEGWPVYIKHSLAFIVDEANSLGGGVAPGGNLYGRLESPLDVLKDGRAVFWESQATPPGTGATPHGLGADPFRSERTPGGWSTRDILPTIGVNNIRETFFVAASADGSSALVATRGELTPGAFTNSENGGAIFGNALFIYRVSTDGTPLKLVTHGETLLPSNVNTSTYKMFRAVSASPDLIRVVFFSKVGLGPGDVCVDGSVNPLSFVEFWDAGVGVARPVVSLGSCVPPNVGHEVPTVLADGRPVIYPNPANPLRPAGYDPLGPFGPTGYTVGPLVVNHSDLGLPNALVALTGPSGAKWLGVSPDGSTAYVLSSDALDASYPAVSTPNIYAVSTNLGTASAGGQTPGVLCLSCTLSPPGVDANPSRVLLSGDSSHLVFFAGDGSLWQEQPGAAQPPQLLAPASDVPVVKAVSENGLHVLASTSSGLQEFTDSQPAMLVEGCGSPVAISDSGQRIVCNSNTSGVEVINEWVNGQIRQISPQDSKESYSTRAEWVTGPELQDIFFLATEPLVPWDTNSDLARIYDARIDGGFPPCTPGNPTPPPNTTSCPTNTSTKNPTPNPIPAHTVNPPSVGFRLGSLPGDTSQRVVKHKPKPKKHPKKHKSKPKKKSRRKAKSGAHAKSKSGSGGKR